jgi:hypothetical protein
MQIGHEIIITGSFLYEQLKFWIPVVSFGWALYKSFSWVKAIREKDLADVKISVASVETGVKETNAAVARLEATLSEHIKSQTVAFVDQIKELRSDFRTFYTMPSPQMIPARARKVVVVEEPEVVVVNETKQKGK